MPRRVKLRPSAKLRIVAVSDPTRQSSSSNVRAFSLSNVAIASSCSQPCGNTPSSTSHNSADDTSWHCSRLARLTAWHQDRAWSALAQPGGPESAAPLSPGLAVALPSVANPRSRMEVQPPGLSTMEWPIHDHVANPRSAITAHFFTPFPERLKTDQAVVSHDQQLLQIIDRL